MNRHRSILLTTTAGLLALSMAGCRGGKSEDPPVHLHGDMDWQPRVESQEASPVFPDGRGMRPLVKGTIPRGKYYADEAFQTGERNGKHIDRIPMDVTNELLERGRERYNIYCAPCHDQSGAGNGTVVQRGYPLPTVLGSERVMDMPDGQIYWTIRNGVRNMPGYASQIPAEDRWAITAWVRVLGQSQYGNIEDVPAGDRGKIQPPDPADAAAAADGATGSDTGTGEGTDSGAPPEGAK